MDAPERLQGRAVSYESAQRTCPARPGLYAFFGALPVWRELQLGEPPDDRPLYVGKAERSLVSRDLDGHFFADPAWGGKDTSPTGHSTLRRSIAALLVRDLGLVPIHRNPRKPEAKYAANYGLRPEDDEKLGAWMRHRLRFTFWPSPPNTLLRALESRLSREWESPLNLDVPTPWRAFVKTQRAKLTALVRNLP